MDSPLAILLRFGNASAQHKTKYTMPLSVGPVEPRRKAESAWDYTTLTFTEKAGGASTAASSEALRNLPKAIQQPQGNSVVTVRI